MKRTAEEKARKEAEDIKAAAEAVEAIKAIIRAALSKVKEKMAEIIKMFQKKRVPTIPKLKYAKGGIIEPRPDIPILGQRKGAREEIIPLSHENKNNIAKLSESLGKVAEALSSTTAAVVIFAAAVREYEKRAAAVFESYPNKRVVHLAKHAKKERVRKKNRNRIIEWCERGGR